MIWINLYGSNEDINVLGVTIAHEDIVSKNYAGFVEKVGKILGAWHNRGLSLCGKIQVVNARVAGTMVARSSSVRAIARSKPSQVPPLHMHVGK